MPDNNVVATIRLTTVDILIIKAYVWEYRPPSRASLNMGVTANMMVGGEKTNKK